MHSHIYFSDNNECHGHFLPVLSCTKFLLSTKDVMEHKFIYLHLLLSRNFLLLRWDKGTSEAYEPYVEHLLQIVFSSRSFFY